jgi:ferredoxin
MIKKLLVKEKSNELTILEIAQNNGIDIEGACEGSLLALRAILL